MLQQSKPCVLPPHRENAESSTDSESPVIAVCGGGTAGHITPGIAVAEEFHRRATGASVIFLGQSDTFCSRLVESAGFTWHAVRSSAWSQQLLRVRLTAGMFLLAGIVAVRRLLKERRVRAVLGMGGYSSVAGVLAARSLRLPVVLFEPNAEPGLANRWLARSAHAVLLGQQSTAGELLHPHARVIGTPVRQSIRSAKISRNVSFGPQAAVPSMEHTRRILVTGGSLGSAFLNRTMPGVLRRVSGVVGPLEITHQVGPGAVEAVTQRYRHNDLVASVVSHVDDMASVYAQSDYVVTAAGAITLAELSAFELPTLVVPLGSSAADHQTLNAAVFASQHRQRHWVRESDWNEQGIAATISHALRSGSDADFPTADRHPGSSHSAESTPSAAIVDILQQLLRRGARK